MDEIFWVKFPKPGQFRGEGVWTRVSEEEYDTYEGFLPRKVEPPRPFYPQETNDT